MDKLTTLGADEFEPAVLVTFDEFDIAEEPAPSHIEPGLLEEIQDTDRLVQAAFALSR